MCVHRSTSMAPAQISEARARVGLAHNQKGRLSKKAATVATLVSGCTNQRMPTARRAAACRPRRGLRGCGRAAGRGTRAGGGCTSRLERRRSRWFEEGSRCDVRLCVCKDPEILNVGVNKCVHFLDQNVADLIDSWCPQNVYLVQIWWKEDTPPFPIPPSTK